MTADGALSVRDDGRGIPVDSPPQAPRQVGAGSDHDGAALGREVLRQGLRDLRRSARRRRLGGQRPVRTAGRKPSGGDGFEWTQSFSRGHPLGPAEKGAPSRKARHPDPASCRIRRFSARKRCSSPPAFTAWRRSKAYLFRGVEIRWRCSPERIHDAHPAPRRPSTSPTALADFLKETGGRNRNR